MLKLEKLIEPNILFKYDQPMEDPRDGLTLFGPLDEANPFGIRAGVIGTKDGIRKFRNWLRKIHEPIIHEKQIHSRPFFPGFKAAFQCEWPSENIPEIVLDEKDLRKHLYHQDQYYRVYNVVALYANPIIQYKKDEDPSVDVWFVMVPDEVYTYCRPNSVVPEDLVSERRRFTERSARDFLWDRSLFESINQEVEPYRYEVNFHEQLKARLLQHQIATQVIRESTLAPHEHLNRLGRPIRKLDNQLSQIAWTLSTAAFYKSGGRPWKLAEIRKGVCYVGLAFKMDLRSNVEGNACCAAQMFLDSGDGVVFKGAAGPWYSAKKGEFHLSEQRAFELMSLALQSYKSQHGGNLPDELFIHAKNRFDWNEWKGFQRAAGDSVKLVGVTIKSAPSLKLYHSGEWPILRGLAYIQNEKSAYLWTKGYVPRLRTSIALEIPNPLYVEVCKGEEDIKVVLQDIMALTKLNYNSCIYADGFPVTLRFADSIGEILTAAPLAGLPPLSFKYYI
jgi:hypothetical protein